MTFIPECACLISSASCPAGMSFVRNPRTFAASDLARDSSCSNAVSMTMAMRGYSWERIFAVEIPSRMGISTSISATSGCAREIAVSASVPFAAVATTLIPS